MDAMVHNATLREYLSALRYDYDIASDKIINLPHGELQAQDGKLYYRTGGTTHKLGRYLRQYLNHTSIQMDWLICELTYVITCAALHATEYSMTLHTDPVAIMELYAKSVPEEPDNCMTGDVTAVCYGNTEALAVAECRRNGRYVGRAVVNTDLRAYVRAHGTLDTIACLVVHGYDSDRYALDGKRIHAYADALGIYAPYIDGYVQNAMLEQVEDGYMWHIREDGDYCLMWGKEKPIACWADLRERGYYPPGQTPPRHC